MITKESDSDWSTVTVQKTPDASQRPNRPSLLGAIGRDDRQLLDPSEELRFWKDVVLPQWSRMCRSALVVKVWHRDGIPAVLRRMVLLIPYFYC